MMRAAAIGFLGLFAMLVLFAAGGLVASAAPDETRALALGAIFVEGAIAVAAIAGAVIAGGGVRERLGWRPGRLGHADLAALVLGTLGLSLAIDSLLDLTSLYDRSALAELEAGMAGARGWTLALSLVGLGLAPGCAEELLCRGLVQGELERRIGPARAIAVAAVFFGALHVEPVHAFFAAVLGAYIGVVAYWAGSVHAAVLCHVVNNLVAVLAAAFDVGSDLPAGPALALGGAVAAVALARVGRSVRRGQPAPAIPEPAASALQPGPGSDDP